MSGILQGVLASIGGAPATYIEDVFSTYLYTGNEATQNITNGIDLAGKGGMLWLKQRSGAQSHWVSDTVRGNTKVLYTNRTNAEATVINNPGGLTFNSNGFSLDGNPYVSFSNSNESGQTYASWTFRKQPKFFDVVTYTGDGSDSRQLAHNLGTSPAFIIIKCTSDAEDWIVGARNNNNNFENLRLNTTAASPGSFGAYPTGSAFVSSTTVGVGWWAMAGQATLNQVNASGRTYVAYLFAHDAGGFGATGTDNVISCGSFTTDGSGFATVSLGYEPQYLMFKRSSGTGNWVIVDTMRGWSMSTDAMLRADLSNAESNTELGNPTATGFYVEAAASSTYIYMAIRRGPMKTPTSGTSVFSPIATTPNANNFAVTTSNLVDMIWSQAVTSSGGDNESYAFDRLRGCSTSSQPFLKLSSTSAQVTQAGQGMGIAQNTGYIDNWFFWNYGGGRTIANWAFTRAPGFFDEVCYTGTGSATTQAHNLGAVPELMIIKRRNTSGTSWFTYSTATGNTNALLLDTTDAAFSVTAWNNTTPTASVFSLGTSVGVNQSASTYVAYLFSSVAGVSKVGSYTGTGSTQTINAGLPTGARFVLIKRTDSTGSWWIWDTARGMVAGTDPRLALETQSSQINNDWVYTVTNGFQIVTTDATVNASGGSYIYLAIA